LFYFVAAAAVLLKTTTVGLREFIHKRLTRKELDITINDTKYSVQTT